MSSTEPPGRPPLADDPAQAPRISRPAVARAMAWAGGSQIGLLVVQLPVTIALARLVAPRDFGLVAMVTVISGFLSVFVDAGLGAALVQRETMTARHVSAAFWLNVCIGAALTAIVAACAPALAALYGQPRLTKITLVLSLDFLVGALGVVQLALMQRHLQFRRIAAIQNTSVAAGGVAAIVAAALGAGVWSLVIDVLATSAVGSALALLLGSRLPKGRFDRVAAAELWRFGGPQMGFAAVNYWSRNADNLIIGKVVGSVALAVYDRAYQLMLVPVSRIGSVVTSVLFPALSRMQDDDARLRHAYLRTVGVTALVTFPLSVGMFVVAPDFVQGVLGHRWHEVTPILRILCVAGLLESVGTTVGVLYQVRGRTDWMFRWGFATAALTVTAFAVGVHWGAKGVATAYAIRSVALIYPSFAIAGRLIGLQFRRVVTTVLPQLLASLFMGAAVWGLGHAIDTLGSFPRFATMAAFGSAVYLLLVHAVQLTSYRELRGAIRSPRRIATSR